MEKLFGTGIGLMVTAVILAVVCIIIFSISTRKLKQKLEQEYGTPKRYNR